MKVKIGQKTSYFLYFTNSCTNWFAVFYCFFSHWNAYYPDLNKTVDTFLFFLNIFWIICFWLFSLKMWLQYLSKHCKKNWITHYKKNRPHNFVQQPVRTVCAKFKVNRLNRFCTEAHWVLTTRKSFINEILLNMKTATASSFKHIFWSNYQLWNFFFKSTFLFASQVNIWIPSRYLSFFFAFSNEIK